MFVTLFYVMILNTEFNENKLILMLKFDNINLNISGLKVLNA